MSSRTKRVPPAPWVYGIADVGRLGAARVPEAVAAMTECGVGWVQIRAKGVSGGQLASLVEQTIETTGPTAVLWIDDRADIAALFPVAGVHVGQEDLPPWAARRAVGGERMIGCSTHDRCQVERAAEDADVDVIAVGPVFGTTTKADAHPAVGLELVRFARWRTDKPIVAIGGIDAGNAPAVVDAGAHAVAAISALLDGDVEACCRRMVEAVGGRA